MNENVKNLINSAVQNIIDHSSSQTKISVISKKHNEKLHFIPKRYRVFGGILQSMNIQFGNFIEKLMELLIKNDGKYEIITDYSGKKSNKFLLSDSNDDRIDKYITKCQLENVNLEKEFAELLDQIVQDKDTKMNTFKHDIDLLFKDKESGILYYAEIKYNDDHDTGKFVDINRKFIKTYAYLTRELDIKDSKKLVPILFYFNNKKMKGNIYVPEDSNIRRGERFFQEFLSIKYSDVDDYMTNLSESSEIIEMFEQLYCKIMKSK